MAGITLVLFDIDGTLLRSGGSGRGAMSQAAAELYGRPDLFDQLSFAGAVDSSIVARALDAGGLPATPRRVGRLKSRYVRRLKTRLRTAAGTLCPGVPEIVEDINTCAHVGLLTGNWEAGARAKLNALGIGLLFEGCVGAYGGDALDRNELVPVAVRRAKRRWGSVSRVIVIGDTPADIHCAQAGHKVLQEQGIVVQGVAVETGFSNREDLQASGPALQVADLVEGRGALLSLIG